MDMGTRIYNRRKALGYSLREASEKVGCTASTWRKWEAGEIANMKTDKIAKIAKALGVTPAFLMGWEEDIKAYKNIEAIPQTKEVPIIGEIACGQPVLAGENYDGTACIDKSIDADFALRCKGDSMINARIFNGDLVFIKQQSAVENGEIAAVLIDGEATLKRVYLYKDRIELRPENPTFPVLNYEGHALQEVRILGKAVAFLSMVR